MVTFVYIYILLDTLQWLYKKNYIIINGTTHRVDKICSNMLKHHANNNIYSCLKYWIHLCRIMWQRQRRLRTRMSAAGSVYQVFLQCWICSKQRSCLLFGHQRVSVRKCRLQVRVFIYERLNNIFSFEWYLVRYVHRVMKF